MAGAQLRVGVIGCGRWAHMAHLPGWTRDPRCEVVAVCDRDPRLAESAAAEFGIGEATADHRRVIERDDIDVIDVITGDSEHFDLTMAALEAGKHVLCEKPVAHDYRDTLRARDLADAKGLQHEGRLHVPLQPRGALHEGADRRGVRRHAVHLQRLRAELPVDRPADAAAPGAAGGERPHRGLVARGLRRAGDRPRPLVHGLRPHLGGRRHAQLRARARDPRHRPDDPGQHRRRRHLHRGVRKRRALLGPVELRHGRQLPRHRGAGVRQRGRPDRAAGRGVRRRRDAEGRRRPTRSSSSTSRCPSGCSRPAATSHEPWPRAVLLEPDRELRRRDPRRRAGRTRATSPTRPGCRRSSTPSSAHITSAPGWGCPWTAERAVRWRGPRPPPGRPRRRGRRSCACSRGCPRARRPAVRGREGRSRRSPRPRAGTRRRRRR